jgi:hypothetical protein
MTTITGIKKPYYRIYREKQQYDGYILDHRYANDRYHLCRAYQLLEQDLLKLFEYVEPSDRNKNVFSQRIYELLLRSATEFETNCKKILLANGYKKALNRDLNINDYKKIEQATKLSQYQIKLNIWYPSSKIFSPLKPWGKGLSLKWYKDYNEVKHHRSDNFEKASLINVVNAISAVWAVLYAQFSYYIFEPYNESSGNTSGDDEFIYSDSTLFSIQPFSKWSKKDAYTFDWPNTEANPFQSFPF